MSQNFKLNNIHINGYIEHIDIKKIHNILIKKINNNFFIQHLDNIKIIFNKLPLVEKAKIERIWPNKLIINLTTNKAIAKLDKNKLIDSNGKIFLINKEKLKEDLPIFKGQNNNIKEITKNYYNFCKLLNPIGFIIKEIKLSLHNSWTVKLSNGIYIKIGREYKNDTLSNRIKNFVKTWKIMHLRDDKIKYIDLRYPNGFAIRITDAHFISK